MRDDGTTRLRDAAALAADHERAASRLMLAFAATGLLFMLFPGTLLGVLNLVSISAGRAAGAVSPEWIQAHGHAQIFGWIGTFIIGIGYRALPTSLKRKYFGVDEGWLSLALWASGALLRWAVGAGAAGWRVLLPLSALLELAGFALFLRASAGHRPSGGGRPGPWAGVVIGGTAGFLLALVAQTALAFRAALSGDTPAFPAESNDRFLMLSIWGFVVPFVWGFTARWVSTMVGLGAARGRHLLAAYLASAAGVACALGGWHQLAAWTLVVAAVWVVYALRVFERATGRPRIHGVHPSFALFVRAAYVWLLVGTGLGLWAATAATEAGGIHGASRHALTVGFLTTMVFSVAPRILPTFTLRVRLFSPRLMALALVTLTTGCALRVVAEILAYQGYAAAAWAWLPVSAVIELAAVAVFAANMAATFLFVPAITRRRYPSRSSTIETVSS
jgi:hypothetical protein